MFGWLSRCWGGIGVNTEFQRARIRSVITDWKAPSEFDICVLVSSFKGENPQVNRQEALSMFLTHMQSDQNHNDPIFMLKNLYILDQSVEQRTALDAISSYNHNEFFTFKTAANIQISPIRELVAAYFLYIKKKAEIYSTVNPAYFNKKDERSQIVQKCESSEIFSLVDKCFQVQKQINNINFKYKGRNKSVQLIQIIFTMLLKSYLFCYSLVSTCARVLFKRLQRLIKVQAVRMYKFVLYFNKDYTRNFVDFIQSNKQIPIFKSIRYSELILIERSYIECLENHIANIENQPASYNQQEQINTQQENSILPLPNQIYQNITEDIKISYSPRKEHRINVTLFSSKGPDPFSTYKNLYCEQYSSQYESSLRLHYNSQQQKMGDNVLQSSKIINTRKVQFQTTKSIVKFNQTLWNDWGNVYSS